MAINRKNIVDASRRRLIEKLAAGGVTSAFAACFVTASLEPGLASAAVRQQGNSTVKLITLLHRKPGMSRDDFIARYESVHSKIGEKYLRPYATRYMRRYTRATEQNVVGLSELPADVIMEIWFPSMHIFHECMQSLMTDEAQAEIIADEELMFDRSRMISFVVDEYESAL